MAKRGCDRERTMGGPRSRISLPLLVDALGIAALELLVVGQIAKARLVDVSHLLDAAAPLHKIGNRLTQVHQIIAWLLPTSLLTG